MSIDWRDRDERELDDQDDDDHEEDDDEEASTTTTPMTSTIPRTAMTTGELTALVSIAAVLWLALVGRAFYDGRRR
jgi:hypothetical protein